MKKWVYGMVLLMVCAAGSLQAATIDLTQTYNTAVPVVGIDNVLSTYDGFGLHSQYTSDTYLCLANSYGQYGTLVYQFTAPTGNHFDGDFSVTVDIATLNLYGAGGVVNVDYKLDNASDYTLLKSLSSVGLASGTWVVYSGTLAFDAQDAQNVYVRFGLGTEWYGDTAQLRNASFVGTVVPEPATLALLAVGAVAAIRRRMA